MADDDYSYFDPRGDTPVGSTWGIGNTQLNPNDPLNDWASNLTPQALQTLRNQYPQDPTGAVQSLIDQGHGPPEHHYTTDASGNLQPVSANDAAALDAAKARLAQGLTGMQAGAQPPQPIQAPPTQFTQGPVQTDAQGRIRGNLTDYPAQRFTNPNPNPPPGEGPPEKPYIFKRPSGATPEAQVPPVYIPGQGTVDPRTGQPTAPPPQPTPEEAAKNPSAWDKFNRWWSEGWKESQRRAGENLNPPAEKPAAPATTPAQPAAPGQPVTPVTNIPPVPEQKPDITMQKGKKKKDEEDEEDKPFGPKALEGFSKSLAGVKVPERKPLPPPTGLGVRAPVSVQQTMANLLSAAGAHAPPTAPPAGLIRLLKGF